MNVILRYLEDCIVLKTIISYHISHHVTITCRNLLHMRSTGAPRTTNIRPSVAKFFQIQSHPMPYRLGYSFFCVYHLLPPLQLWRLLSKTISNAKCNFSIHPSTRLPSSTSKRCQRWSCHLDFALSKALQNTLSKYHLYIFRKKTARCLRKSEHLTVKNRSL